MNEDSKPQSAMNNSHLFKRLRRTQGIDVFFQNRALLYGFLLALTGESGFVHHVDMEGLSD